MDQNAVKNKIIELGPWFHQIEITPELRTRDIAPSPGPQPIDHPLWRWQACCQYLPEDMTGLRVLDMGCADGFFTIQLARRGAEVVAVDAARKMITRLEWAVQMLGLKNVTAKVGLVEDFKTDETYDWVFFLAVLYHLKSPLPGLEKMAAVTDRIIVETEIALGKEPYLYLKPPQPGLHTVPKWYPTRNCVEEMMKMAGFRSIENIPIPKETRAMYIGRR